VKVGVLYLELLSLGR